MEEFTGGIFKGEERAWSSRGPWLRKQIFPAPELIHFPLIAQLSLKFWPVLNLLTGREGLDDFVPSHWMVSYRPSLLDKAFRNGKSLLLPPPRKQEKLT